MADTSRLTPDERYRRDIHYKKLVDTIMMFIVEGDYTPTELREAVVLAATRYEIYHARPSYLMDPDGTITRTDRYHTRTAE